MGRVGGKQKEIQTLYAAHRTKRNLQQRDKFLSPNFEELAVDQHLLGLETRPGFRDERNCMTLWARPPEHILKLAAKLQDELKAQAPSKPGISMERDREIS